MLVQHERLIDLRHILQPEVEVLLKQRNPGVGVSRAQENCVGARQVLGRDTPCVANLRMASGKFRKLRQHRSNVQTNDAGIALLAQIIQIFVAESWQRLQIKEIIAIRVLLKSRESPGKILQDPESTIGRHNQSVSIRLKQLHPHSMGEAWCSLLLQPAHPNQHCRWADDPEYQARQNRGPRRLPVGGWNFIRWRNWSL